MTIGDAHHEDGPLAHSARFPPARHPAHNDGPGLRVSARPVIVKSARGRPPVAAGRGTPPAAGSAMPGGCAPATYQRRQPEDSSTVRAHLGAFLARATGEDGASAGLRAARIQGLLRCGLLEHGCLHVGCEGCRDDVAVSFSCKGRGI